MPGQDVLVIGLGYVGLPLAIAAARSGLRVTGLDLNAEIVAGVMAGRSHVDDVTGAEITVSAGPSSPCRETRKPGRAAGRVERQNPSVDSRCQDHTTPVTSSQFATQVRPVD